MSEGLKIDAKISQIGSSLGAIIPSLFCNAMKLEKATPIIIELQTDKIIITKGE